MLSLVSLLVGLKQPKGIRRRQHKKRRMPIEQRLTQLMMGDKSERAQKVFALDYCASAFVTEGAPSTTPPAVPRACRVRRDGEPWRSANQASGRGCARRTREVRDAHWEKRFRGTVGHQHAAAVTRVGARTRLREERVLVGSSY